MRHTMVAQSAAAGIWWTSHFVEAWLMDAAAAWSPEVITIPNVKLQDATQPADWKQKFRGLGKYRLYAIAAQAKCVQRYTVNRKV